MTTTDEQSYWNEPSLDLHAVAENPESSLGDDEDRLSALPEEILHQILSYLNMPEVIKTSLLSTRWRNLWKSHPFFELCSSEFVPKFGGIMDFIEHVLLLRDHHSSKLLQFRLRFGKNCEVHRFLELIVTAMNQGVQVIDTLIDDVDDDDDDDDDEEEEEEEEEENEDDDDGEGITTTLNPCIFESFDSGVVRVFSLSVTVSLFRIQIPLSMCSSTHLRIVHLRGIKLPEGNSKKELHLICPVLVKLDIINCSHKHLSVLSISTPKLETLFISHYLNMPTFRKLHGGKCILEINTPILKSFKYIGYSYEDFTFRNNLPFLTHAAVELDNHVEQETNFLRSIKILKGISNAKSLRIDRFEIFSWAPNTLRKEVLRNPFTRLRYLTLESIPSLSSVHGMTYLLLTTRKVLKTFVWEVRKGGSVKEDEGEEHKVVRLPKVSFSHLKLVKTMNLRGHKNELIFLRFLLKSAVFLEEMIITTANPNKEIADEEIEENQEHLKQRKFMEKLEALRNCCSSTKLTFKIN